MPCALIRKVATQTEPSKKHADCAIKGEPSDIDEAVALVNKPQAKRDNVTLENCTTIENRNNGQAQSTVC